MGITTSGPELDEWWTGEKWQGWAIVCHPGLGERSLGLTDRPRQLNQRGALLVPENKWRGVPHSSTAYDFPTSHTIPFLQKTVLIIPKWNQRVDEQHQDDLVSVDMTWLALPFIYALIPGLRGTLMFTSAAAAGSSFQAFPEPPPLHR